MCVGSRKFHFSTADLDIWLADFDRRRRGITPDDRIHSGPIPPLDDRIVIVLGPFKIVDLLVSVLNAAASGRRYRHPVRRGLFISCPGIVGTLSPYRSAGPLLVRPEFTRNSPHKARYLSRIVRACGKMTGYVNGDIFYCNLPTTAI